MISKLIKHEYVWISSEASNIRILKHYSQFNLIEAKVSKQESFNGILVRKNLHKRLKSRVKQL